MHPRQELADLVADTLALLDAMRSSAVRWVPADPRPTDARPADTSARPIAPEGRPAVAPRPVAPEARDPRPADPRPVAPRPVVAPVSPSVATPMVTPVAAPEPTRAPPPVIAPPPDTATAGKWAAFLRDPQQEMDRHSSLWTDCARCGRSQTRRRMLFGAGTVRAKIVIIGNPPTPEEEAAGRLFIGPAGEMLDKMLENVLGLRRDQVWLTPALPCAGEPLPAMSAFQTCRPWLQHQIELVRPACVLTMGLVPTRALLGDGVDWISARGIWQQWMGFSVMPTFHPSDLLVTPAEKKKALQDLQAVKKRL